MLMIFDYVFINSPIDGDCILLMVIFFSVPTSSIEMVHLSMKKIEWKQKTEEKTATKRHTRNTLSKATQ